MPRDWLSSRRSEVAADHILDAADALFTQQDAATVGMHEIAAAAGCSRATLYRYFENRDALYTAYVHREARRLYEEVSEQVVAVTDPAQRLIEGVITALNAVRDSPALASWFATAQRPIGGEMAEHSEVIRALVEGSSGHWQVNRGKPTRRWAAGPGGWCGSWCRYWSSPASTRRTSAPCWPSSSPHSSSRDNYPSSRRLPGGTG